MAEEPQRSSSEFRDLMLGINRISTNPDITPDSESVTVRFLARAARALGGIYLDFRMAEIEGYPDDTLEFVSPAYRADYVQANNSLASTLADVMRVTIALDRNSQGAELEPIMWGLLKLRAAALEILATLEIPVSELAGRRLQRMARPDNRSLLLQQYAAVVVRIATGAITLHSSLARILESAGGPGSEETGNAIRRRRYRNRKRRRVAAVVPVEIYDDDLHLLTRFRFLTTDEKLDVEAVAKSVEAFLLQAFLMYQTPDELSLTPWRERIASQHGRIRALSERQTEQDEQ